MSKVLLAFILRPADLAPVRLPEPVIINYDKAHVG